MAEKVQAKIVSIAALNDTISQYILKPHHYVAYTAGQYLQVHQSDMDSFFSIANAPNQAQIYELHVRHRPQHPPLGIKDQELCLSLPYGKSDIGHLYPHNPILFLAFGTGFAPIRAMINALSSDHDPRPFDLHWGVSVAADLYDQASLQRWEKTLKNYHFFSHIALSNQSNVVPSLIKQYPDLNHWQIVMAGPFELMYGLQEQLIQHGCQKTMIFSDAFD